MKIFSTNAFIMSGALIHTLALLRQFRAYLVSLKPHFFTAECAHKDKSKKNLTLAFIRIFGFQKCKEILSKCKTIISTKKNSYIHKTNNPIKIHTPNLEAACLRQIKKPPLFLTHKVANPKNFKFNMISNIFKNTLLNSFFLLNYLKLAPISFIPAGAGIFFKNKQSIISNTKNLSNKIKTIKNNNSITSELYTFKKKINETNISSIQKSINNSLNSRKSSILNQNIDITINADKTSEAKELAYQLEQRIIPILSKEIGLKS